MWFPELSGGWMRLVLDYGGVLAHHGDEREYAHLLGVDPEREPYPGWLAYYLFRAGFLKTEAEYVDLLSTLTGASEDRCHEYVERTWLNPDFPDENVETLENLAGRHSLVLLSNMAKPWVDEVLRRHGARDLFDSVLVSSDLERPKPHPKGYLRSLEGASGPVAMVSDEFDEDLLVADCLGMTTIWVENDDEEPYRQPDHVVDDFGSVPQVVEQMAE